MVRVERAAWRAAEQVAWSASTFVGSAVGASLLTLQGFGILALATAGLLFAQAVSRAAFSEVLAMVAVLSPRDVGAARRIATRQVVGAAPIVLAVVVPALLLWVPGDYRATAVVAVCLCCAQPLADLKRSSLLILGRVRSSAATMWAAVALQCLVTVALWLASHDPYAFLAGWLAAVLCYASVPDRDLARAAVVKPDWRAVQRRFAPRFITESLITVGGSQGSVGLLAGVAGVSAAAGVRGAMLLMFPISMAVQSFSPVLVPRVAPLAATRRGLRQLCLLCTGLLVAVLVYAAAVAHLPVVTTILLGHSWAVSLRILPGVACFLAASVSLLVPWAGARARERPNAGLCARALLTLPTLTFPALGFRLVHSLTGVALGYAAVGLLSMAAAAGILVYLNARTDTVPPRWPAAAGAG